MKNITVVGAGYVGLANSFLIGLSRSVTLIDINEQKIMDLNNGKSPINDDYINQYINKINVKYTTNKEEAYRDADIIFVATDTNYDDELNEFNLKSVYGAIEDVIYFGKSGAIIVIKSTVPIGFTDKLQAMHPNFKFIFSPEFLREGFALYDNLYPDRIVVGGNGPLNKEGQIIAELLKANTKADDIPVVFATNHEAEVVKLFANTYLAMRVSFVNELDTYCQSSGIGTANVLEAIGYDKRIGRDYWNPSFGYGGYCLPKDTKQLNSEYVSHAIPQNLVSNIVKSNETRKRFIADTIARKIGGDRSRIIGIYRVIAKKGINNFRSSAVLDVAQLLIADGYSVVIYEPFSQDEINGIKVIADYQVFEQLSSVIVANRLEEQIVGNPKVYSVDIYNQY